MDLRPALVRRWTRGGGVLALAVATVATPTGVAVAPPAGQVTLEVLSGRADLVTGHDALVRVALPQAGDLRGLRVDVDGRDVTRSFARRADGQVAGPVTGLRTRRNTLTARTARGAGAARAHRPPDHRAGAVRPPDPAVGVQHHRPG